MIINPFKQNKRVDKPNRNAFDLSHAVNFTSQFGKLYPILCKEVVPGDSFNIKSVMGLRLMPLAFPVQSRMRADIHFFYVRNRNLWKDWTDFIGATKTGLVPPFIQRTADTADNIFATGTLGDYLGVPTTVAVSGTHDFTSAMLAACSLSNPNSLPVPQNVGNDCVGWQKSTSSATITAGITQGVPPPTYERFQTNPLVGTGTISNVVQSPVLKNLDRTFNALPTSKFELMYASGTILPSRIYFVERGNIFAWTTTSLGFALSGGVYRSNSFNTITVKNYMFSGRTESLDTYLNLALQRCPEVGIIFECPMTDPTVMNPRDTAKFNNIFNGVAITNIAAPQLDEIVYQSLCPYVGANPAIRISALPFRAYESIYNGFYRNQQNDPFKINGTVEYNRFVTTNEGGADTTLYEIQSRNWEQDFLTTALPSPQQGIAPLVGARTVGGNTYNMVVTMDGVEKTLEVRAGSQGQLEAIQNIPTGSDGGNYFPESSIQALNSAVDFGISINDFRNVNCLQRWLEKNVKHGYRYRDQLKSHFGVDVRFEVLDMPEFLGGLSQEIQVNSISQTVDTENAPLGSYAGQAHAFGGSNHDVNSYFDEHGFIFAIFSVSPIPSYSQLLPKHLIKSNHLDYYTPEFGHIGLQPIPIKEVSPNEAALQAVPQDRVFGYQRPFYDYLAATDSVHGQMRTTMRDFLVNRYFETPPQLGGKFLKIDNEEVNDIFTVTDDSNDCIVGQVYFKIIAKRPISRFAEPRID